MGNYVFEKTNNWIRIYEDNNKSSGSKLCNDLSEYMIQKYTMGDSVHGDFYISKTHNQITDIMTTQIWVRDYVLEEIIDRFPFIVEFIVETYL